MVRNLPIFSDKIECLEGKNFVKGGKQDAYQFKAVKLLLKKSASNLLFLLDIISPLPCIIVHTL